MRIPLPASHHHKVLRRLVDIQGKLHESRARDKAAAGGVPMGMPIGQPAKPVKAD